MREVGQLRVAKSIPGQQSPFGVTRAIESCALRFGVNIVDVLATPARGIGVVLDGTQAPFCAAGHGVKGNAAQEANFAVVTRPKLNTLDEGFQVRRIAFATGRYPDEVAVGIVFVAIYGISYFAKVAVKLGLFLAHDCKTKNWQCCGRENEQE